MAIRMKTVVTLKASATCPTHARSEVAIRDLRVTIDEPEARGGTNAGPSPTEMTLAALIGCTNIIGNKCAKHLGVDIGHLAIDAECEFDRRGVTLEEEIEAPFPSVRVTVTADGPASQADLDRVGREVEKFCPISKLYENAGATVVATWRKK